MKKIKILVPIHVMPNRATVLTIFLNSVFPIMKKEVDVEIVWFVFQYEKEDIIKSDSGQVILQREDFDNAVEVIEKIKPDLIYLTPTYDLINFPFNLASKKYEIPSFFHRNSDIWRVRYPRNFFFRAKTYLASFFENSLPTDQGENKIFMKRGRFFLKKYLFLIQTQKALGYSKFGILKTLLIIIKSLLFYSGMDKKFNPKFEFLENEDIKNKLISDGHSEKGLEVVGHPLFDTAIKKFQNQEQIVPYKEKIKVLFLPSTLVEHNFWNKKERNEQYNEILKTLNKNSDKILLTIKIHPTTSRIEEYKKLVKPINPNIPIIQKGNVLDIVGDYDVIISERFSSAEMYAIIARKPIVMCNFFNLPYDILLEKNLAIECKSSKDLIDKIYDSIKYNPEYEKYREIFLKESIFRLDGKAGERIARKLIDIVKQRKNA